MPLCDLGRQVRRSRTIVRAGSPFCLPWPVRDGLGPDPLDCAFLPLLRGGNLRRVERRKCPFDLGRQVRGSRIIVRAGSPFCLPWPVRDGLGLDPLDCAF
jgi:hypothetical protein